MELVKNLLNEAYRLVGGLAVPLFLGGALFAALAVLARFRRLVGPDEAMVVYGRGQTTYDKEGLLIRKAARVITAGGTIVWPVIEAFQKVYLGVMTITQDRDGVITQSNVPVILDWVCQLITPPDEASILAAARTRSKFDEGELKQVAKDALSGAFREVVATLTPEQIHKDKQAFALQVVEFAAREMATYGWKISMLNVKEISDAVGYFEALGKPRIAEVKSQAVIAEAMASKRSRVEAAQAKEEAEKAEILAEQRIAEEEKKRDVQKASYKEEADKAKAKADLAYDLEDTQIREELVKRTGAMEIEKQRQAALAAEQAIAVATKRAQAETVVPAEAAKRASIEKATGDAEATKLSAAAEAEKTRVTKEAEAVGIQAVGAADAGKEKAKLLAQADGERQLAEARAAQGEINLRQLIVQEMMKARVETAKAFAEALAGIGANMKVVQFTGAPGSGQTGNVLLDTLMQIPELAAVLNAKSEALTGKDVTAVLAEVVEVLRGNKQTTEESQDKKS